jgi:Dna[CI] antecedent, DciA
MERAGRAFQKHTLSKPLLTEEEVLRAAWRSAVGKIISRHTSRVRLVRNTLVVEVEDAVWQRQLNSLWHQILEQVRHATGNSVLENIEFRIAVPRRAAQRAASANEFAARPALNPSGLSAQPRPVPGAQGTLWSGDADEADQIQDPVLKKVYQLSRRKASA